MKFKTNTTSIFSYLLGECKQCKCITLAVFAGPAALQNAYWAASQNPAFGKYPKGFVCVTAACTVVP